MDYWSLGNPVFVMPKSFIGSLLLFSWDQNEYFIKLFWKSQNVSSYKKNSSDKGHCWKFLEIKSLLFKIIFFNYELWIIFFPKLQPFVFFVVKKIIRFHAPFSALKMDLWVKFARWVLY